MAEIKLQDVYDKLLELEAKIDEPKSVQRICYHCGGDGMKVGSGVEPFTCPDCGGDGVVIFGRITTTSEE